MRQQPPPGRLCEAHLEIRRRSSERTPDVRAAVPDESEVLQKGRERRERSRETQAPRSAERVPGPPEEILQGGERRAERPVGNPGRESERAVCLEPEKRLSVRERDPGVAGGRRVEAGENGVAPAGHRQRRLLVVRSGADGGRGS